MLLRCVDTKGKRLLYLLAQCIGQQSDKAFPLEEE
jgi:hypothetical protein